MNTNTKKITTMGMLSALAFIVLLIGKIGGGLILFPQAAFLPYDPKDVIIAIGALILGPLEGVIISVVVSLIEMLTISSTGFYGFFMNVVSTCAFILPAGIIYRKKHTIKGAILGLFLGVICMTVVMILWNYIITPGYMGVERSMVVGMIPTVFLPFNLMKATVNMALTLLLYKAVITALRRAHLVEERPAGETESDKKSYFLVSLLLGLMLLGACVLVFLIFHGVIG